MSVNNQASRSALFQSCLSGKMPDSFENLNIIMTRYFFSSEIQAEEPKGIQTGHSWKKTDAILIFCVVVGIIVAVGVFSAMIFMILHW